MATSDIVQRARAILYGYGLGEKPALVEVNADAAETITGTSQIVFNLAAGEGARSKLAAGDVLSVFQSASAAAAFVMYVKSVSTDAVTATLTYGGSPASTTDDLDGLTLEILPGGAVSEHLLYQHVETVFASLLWEGGVWAYNTYAVTPDLSDYQVELNAAVEEIEQAWQVVAGRRIDIGFGMEKNVHTSVSSTTVIAELVALDGSNVFLTVRERLTESSTLDEAQTQCIATGAAALAAGGSVYSATLEASSKDNQARAELSPSRALWNDFGTLRQAISNDLALDSEGFEYDRG